MSNISVKSVGVLIDELITTSMKCWYAQEVVCSGTDPVKVADAAKKAQEFNARRTALIRALDAKLDQDTVTVGTKTYAGGDK